MDPGTKAIRIIETRRVLVDPLTAKAEDLDLIVESMEVPLKPLTDLVRIAQGPLSPYLAPYQGDDLDSVLVRKLITNPKIRPLVSARGASAAEEVGGVYTRPSGRTQATATDGAAVSIAAEEPVVVRGFVLDPAPGPSPLMENALLGENSPAVGGFCNVPLLAASGPVWYPEFVEGEHGIESAALAQIFLQARAAIHFYFSGAAAALCLPRVPARSGTSLTGQSASLTGHIVLLPARTWRRKSDEEWLRYLMGRLSVTDQWVYDLVPLCDLYRMGGLEAYLSVLEGGPESENLADFFETVKADAFRTKALLEMSQKMTESVNRAQVYMIVLEDKLGAARVKKLFDDLRGARIAGPETVTAVLSKAEREIVETEYQNRTRLWAEETKNKCPHVKLVQKLRQAPTVGQALSTLRALSEFFRVDHSAKRRKTLEWILCANCGFRVLCPHVRDLISLTSRRAPYDEVRTKLLDYAVTVPIQDPTGVYSYFCRVCAEKLAESFDDKRALDPLDEYGGIELEARTRVWTIAIGLARKLRFPIPTDERQFASAVTDAVHPVLSRLDDESARRRRRPLEDEDPRNELNALLAVYAYVLVLIRTTPNLGYLDIKLGAKPGVYEDRMLKEITTERHGVLSRVEGLTPEHLRARFEEMHKRIFENKPDQLKTSDPEEELATQLLTVDPVYRYAADVARLVGDLPMGRAVTPAALRKEFELVLGASLPDLAKRARGNLKDPILAPLYNRRVGAQVPLGHELEFFLKDPRLNLYANLYEPPAHVDRKSARVGGAGRRHSKKAQAQPETTTRLSEYYLESYRAFVSYTKNVTDRSAYEAHQKTLEGLRRLEATARERAHLQGPYHDFKFSREFKFRRVDVPVTLLYDEEGTRHDWSKKVTYVFRVGDKEIEVPGGPGGAETARSVGDLTPEAVLIDCKCPICGVLKSKIDALDTEKAWSSVRAASDVEALYIFYESRCPAGGLHEWVSEACVRCGLTTSILGAVADGRAFRDPGAREYYVKYSPEFVKERQTANKYAPSATPAPSVSAAEAGAFEYALQWKSDYSLILRAAELADVGPRVIEAIGSTEGREYPDIVEGVDTPPPPTVVTDPRILAADAEVRSFLSDYSTFRNLSRFPKSSEKFLEVLDGLGFTRPDYPKLLSLPSADVGYGVRFLAMLRNRPPPDTLSFVIQTLCRMALEIADSGDTGTAFARFELKRVLRQQKLLSKPLIISWALFEPGDDLVPEQVGDVGEDVLDEIITADNEEEPYDPFSGENMDYDTSADNPNNEPSDL